ncbi:MAG TPA: hypothetical protein VEX38_05405 [Fimbriimonadaceae bacterium]|nr:hypothetical protein [Fimbriimonadaceae bacterium]
MKTPLLRLVALFSFAVVSAISPAQAEEKNGLQVSVQKTTLDRSDQREGAYYDRIDRTQGLKVTIKNVSFKAMPEGEVEWTILVRKYYSTTVEKHEGKEKLKPLKVGESVQLVIGSAQIQGWRDLSGTSKDKIEHEVVVKQNGVETMRMASMSGFEALRKRAIKASSR